MADITKLRTNLEEHGFATSYFETAKEAADYLDSQINGVSVGIGGSITVQELDLYDRLAAHNTVHWHWKEGSVAEAATADVYLVSANGVAETGEIINIDGTGNRVSAFLYGHKKVYIIIGVNKIAPDYDAALWRARNIAAPKNAQRLKRDTPCAVNGDKCYNCKSAQRICKGLVVLWNKMGGNKEMEVVIVNQNLGY